MIFNAELPKLNLRFIVLSACSIGAWQLAQAGFTRSASLPLSACIMTSAVVCLGNLAVV